jgi:hypothetical protein
MISSRINQILSKRDKNTIKILEDLRGRRFWNNLAIVGEGIGRPGWGGLLGFSGETIYCFPPDERLINTKMPTMIRIIGHHWDMSVRRGGSQPRLDRRKMIPNPIRMYAPIADLDFITAPP